MKKIILLGTILLFCIGINAETKVSYKNISYTCPGKLIKGPIVEKNGAFQFTYDDNDLGYSVYVQCIPLIYTGVTPDEYLQVYENALEDTETFHLTQGIHYDISFAGVNGRALEVKFAGKGDNRGINMFSRWVAFKTNKYILYVSITARTARELEYIFKSIDSSFHVDE